MSARLDRVYANETPGIYAVRRAKGAVEIACEVTHGPAIDPDTGETLDRSWMWAIRFNGEPTPSYCSPAPYPRLLIGRPIDRAEYDFLVADRRWSREHAPHSPEANPHKRVDLSTVPVPF